MEQRSDLNFFTNVVEVKYIDKLNLIMKYFTNLHEAVFKCSEYNNTLKKPISELYLSDYTKIEQKLINMTTKIYSSVKDTDIFINRDRRFNFYICDNILKEGYKFNFIRFDSLKYLVSKDIISEDFVCSYLKIKRDLFNSFLNYFAKVFKEADTESFSIEKEIEKAFNQLKSLSC